jgi:hypothetical protein
MPFTRSPHKYFEPIGTILPGIVKEISQRAELRSRLEAEWDRPLTNEEIVLVA